MATDFSAQITSWYQAVQFRNPPAADLATYNAALQNGTLTTAQVQSLIINDPFTTNIVNVVIREYQAAFGRVPDRAGLDFWVDSIAANPSLLANLNTTFANSAEFQARFGANANTPANAALVATIYQQVYGRAPDAQGLQFWSTGFPKDAAGNPLPGAQPLTAAQLLQQFANAPEYVALTAGPIATYENLAVTGGTIPTTGSLFEIPGGTSVNLNLSLQAETLSTSTAGATFTANPITTQLGTVGNSLNAGDKLTDTAGDGTLNYTAVAPVFAGNPAFAVGVTMDGIKTANVTNLSAGLAGFQGTITGLTTATLTAGSNGALQLGAAGQGLNTKLATLNVNANQAATVFVAANALTGTSDAITVNTTGNQGTAAAANVIIAASDGAAGTAATPMNAYEVENISATGPSFLQLSNAGTGVVSTNTVNVSGAGSVQLGAGAAGHFAKLTTIDASANTGGVTITGALNLASQTTAGASAAGLLAGNTSLTSAKFGSGNDFIDITSMTTAAQLAAFTTLDGGAGRDTLVLNAALANTTTALVDANFEVIGFGAGVTGTVDVTKLGGNTVDTVALFGATAGAVNITNAPSTFTYAAAGFQNTNALTIATPAASTATTDVLNITENNTAGTGTFGAITVTGYETINDTITGSGAQTHGALTATPSAGALATYNITDNLTGGATLTLGATNVGAGTIKVAGTATGGVTIGAVTAGVLDASGLTGIAAGTAGLTMTAGAAGAISITGTGGIDTLTGSAAADSINAGAGNDIVATQVAGVATAAADNVTLGAGFDAITLRGANATAGGAQVVSNTAGSAVSTTASIADFTVGSLTTNTDILRFDATNAATSYTGVTALNNATVAAAGSNTVQAVVANVPGQAIGATTELLKLGSFTETPGTTTVAQAFAAAIGTGTVTGLGAGTEVFFSMYDATAGRAIFGVVDAGTDGVATTTVSAADATGVTIIGSAVMSAADYAALSNNNVAFV